jgi:AraC-like DNA-binding protein
VDRLLADLGRMAGGSLPIPFKAFARHALELPVRYTDLSDVAGTFELSRGALKARFRRRGLESPFTYLRWLRAMAVGEVLSDPSVTVAQAADRLGFTSGTNMCRMVRVLTGATPGSLREPGARRWLLVGFARVLLRPEALEGWARLEDVFGRRVA